MSTDIKIALWNLREELVDSLPTVEVNAFDLIVLIKKHVAQLDELIDRKEFN
jgi:hypothetical protein